jgi:hypothetical protein
MTEAPRVRLYGNRCRMRGTLGFGFAGLTLRAVVR